METIKERLGRMKSDLSLRGEVALGRPEIIRGAECLLRFLLALALARAEVFGGYTPFGVAVVAVSGAGIMGFLALCGVVLGSYLGGDFFFGLKYVAIAVLVYAANFVFHDLEVYQTSWFRPAVATLMATAAGFVYALDMGFTATAVVFYITETTLIGGSAYFFQIALSGWGEARPEEEADLKRTVSVLILIGTCLIALAHVTGPLGISAGRLLAVFLVMCTAYKHGTGSGSSAGAALGIAMDAGLGGTPFFSMAYAFSGLLSGLFGRHGRLFFTLSFILANAVAVLWTWGSPLHTAAVYEVFLVSMSFMLLPNSVVEKFAIDLGSEEGGDYLTHRARVSAQGRITRLSSAFLTLYETVKAPPIQRKNDNDIAAIFDRAAEGCCRKCQLSVTCWCLEYEATLDAMNNATAPMLERGELKAEDLPLHFRESCKHLGRYIDLVNFELRALTLRRQQQSRLLESQAALATQYADVGAILSGLANELDRELSPDPLRERKLRRFLKSQDIEPSAAVVFLDRDGRLHAEIKGPDIGILLRDGDRLAKLSAVLGVRLCERRTENAGHKRERIALMEAEPLAAAVGIASIRRRGQAVSGDRSTYFKTEDGKLCLILCDGMGTGAEAARESGQLSDMLEQFLQAGLDPATAMKLLNGAFQVKNGAVTGSCSVDLLSLDLFTGETKLFKYGAAPTYIKRGPTVRSVRGESFAAGLGHAGANGPTGPDTATLRLEPGNFALLVSDGVSLEEDDEWLRTCLEEYPGTEAKALARTIVEAAIARSGHEDDKTVLAVFLEKRG